MKLPGPLTTAVLDCLTEPAILLQHDHRIVAANRAYRSAFADGDEVVGRHCYEVSHRYGRPCPEHGESCPMALSQETREPCRVVHVHYTPRGEEHEEVVSHPLLDGDKLTGSFLEVIQPLKFATVRPKAEGLVGRSPAFNRMLELVDRVAPTDTAALLLGESGTGKELLARAIHEASRRRTKPFVPLDCSGLTETLFESELFGHERGAFTGAVSRRRGLVEAAEGGTLFLDEVGDIPLSQQVKLLRLLETGCFRRVGSVDLVQGDFRLICATHRDLKKVAGEGRFRQDLYYRISAFPIQMPPLRERSDDIPLLIEAIQNRLKCWGECALQPESLATLKSYSFPGNVRELINILERACLLADGDSICPHHLPEECHGEPGSQEPLPGTIVPLADVEERYLRWAADRFQGDNRDLAQRLGLSERTLYRKLHKIRGPEGGGQT